MFRFHLEAGEPFACLRAKDRLVLVSVEVVVVSRGPVLSMVWAISLWVLSVERGE